MQGGIGETTIKSIKQTFQKEFADYFIWVTNCAKINAINVDDESNSREVWNDCDKKYMNLDDSNFPLYYSSRMSRLARKHTVRHLIFMDKFFEETEWGK